MKMRLVLFSFGAREAAELLPVPSADVNKYSRGAMTVIAGSQKYPGAAVLAAKAGACAGAGYTTLVTPKSSAFVARNHLLSIPVRETSEVQGSFWASSLLDATDAIARAKALVLGPGIDRGQEVQEFVWTVLKNDAIQQIPLVLDADALYAIALDRGLFISCRPEGCVQVLTPHEGEAARLLGEKVTDRANAAVTLAKTWNSIVVLKGPKTIVACPDGRLTCVENGGPELSKAGTGDVLAGMIGAFLAQRLNSYDAACLGVYLHGKAGALAAKKAGLLSLMPEDLLECIGSAICSLESWSPQLASAQVDLSRRAQL